jgi:hypothetical protein
VKLAMEKWAVAAVLCAGDKKFVCLLFVKIGRFVNNKKIAYIYIIKD